MSTELNAYVKQYMGELQKKWKAFLVLGIVLVVLGMAAVSLPFFSTWAIEIMLGWIFVFGGVAKLVDTFHSKKWGGFFLKFLSSLLYVAAGILLLVYPLQGVLTLTIVLAVVFIVEGVFKIVASLQLRPMTAWGWLLFSGIIALVLGLFIWAEWPSDAKWVIGIIVGINMLFGGWTLIMLALAAHKGGGRTAIA